MRAWDLASSIRGDWTVGIKLACTYDEQFETVLTIVDVQRFRGAPEEVHSQVLTIAQADGHGCTIALPEDPGQAGQSQVTDFTRMLQGYVVMPVRLTGSKEIRALATASQANIGRIRMLRAPWNAALIDELQSFPSGRHDDQVDALSLGHDLMMGKMASLAAWARL
jgi:predicted phage terminase large subunit-like protein